MTTHFARVALAVAGAMTCSPLAWAEFDFSGSFGAGHQTYVPPLSNPLFNETPYITTEARPIYFYQAIPDGFLTGGGEIRVTALELRLALSERFGLIASKDGYADVDFRRTLPDETGFANISIGGKYALISDPVERMIVTVGAEYEVPIGNLRTGGISLQGDGDGFLDLFVSAARRLGNLGLEGNIGVNLAIDDDHDTSMLHVSGHADYGIGWFYPLVEINAFVPVRDGNRTPVDFEGIDLVNFGATDANTVVTAAFGGRFDVNPHLVLGVGYERTIGQHEDLMDYRFYVDAQWLVR